MKEFSLNMLLLSVASFVFMICITIYLNVQNYYNGHKECPCAIKVLNETDVKELCNDGL